MAPQIQGMSWRSTAERNPGGELYHLKRCGHGVLFERADEALAKVIDFLKAQ
jgi:pimeloyl-ACP methyl ester carboxylesterase